MGNHLVGGNRPVPAQGSLELAGGHLHQAVAVVAAPQAQVARPEAACLVHPTGLNLQLRFFSG